jgi:hypothetical protein
MYMNTWLVHVDSGSEFYTYDQKRFQRAVADGLEPDLALWLCAQPVSEPKVKYFGNFKSQVPNRGLSMLAS